MADLPYQREKSAERKALFSKCDPNGNGYASVAEIDAIFRRKYGFGEKQKMPMIEAFDEAKNYSGKERGVSSDYIEYGEFRVFLEILMKKLGLKVVEQAPAKSDLTISAPKVKRAAAPAAFAVELPYQREKLKERQALYADCDKNGNGYCSVAEIDAVLRQKFKFGGEQKMPMIHAFDEAKNFSGKEKGVSGDYIEHGEFRIFLEILMKKLGMKVVPQAPAKENLMINHPKAKAAKSKAFTADLPYQPERLAERKALCSECDPDGNGYCSVASIDAVLRRKYGFGEEQKMKMIDAFNAAKNYSGKERGVSADYIEHREFRIFLETLCKKLGMKIEQGKGAHFLSGSKVGSMKSFMTVGGTIIAIPHPKPGKSSSLPDLRARFNGISESQHKFAEMPYSYCSMERKPLCPYDPNAQRNRLAVDDAPVPYKNASTIEFNDGIHVIHKNRFKTIQKTDFNGEPVDMTGNHGIFAHSHKVKRRLREM
jgi:hypothetical protein